MTWEQCIIYTYIYQKIAERSFPRVEYEPPVLPALNDVRVLVQLSFLNVGQVLDADRVHGTKVWHRLHVVRNANVYFLLGRTRRIANRKVCVRQDLKPISTVTADRLGTSRPVGVETGSTRKRSLCEKIPRNDLRRFNNRSWSRVQQRRLHNNNN